MCTNRAPEGEGRDRKYILKNNGWKFSKFEEDSELRDHKKLGEVKEMWRKPTKYLT